MSDTDIYQSMAKTARSEGFDEIAEWFECIAKTAREPIVDLTIRLNSPKRITGTSGFTYLDPEAAIEAMAEAADRIKSLEAEVGRLSGLVDRLEARHE